MAAAVRAVARAATGAALALLAVSSLPAQQPASPSDIRRAVQTGDLEAMRSLVKGGADINRADEYGMTPLAVAAINRREAILRLLLDAGADPNRVDNTATTALQHAVEWSELSIVTLLLDHGADPNIAGAIPPLLVAADQGSVDIVKLLLQRGADPHLREDATDRTARESVERDLEDLERVPAPPDSSSRARLDSMLRHLREVRGLLLAAEARVPRRAASSLLDAAQVGQLEAASGFLARGAKVDSTDRNGRTPLRWAAFRGHTEIVRLLLERGANVNAQDRWGVSVLMAAADKGRTDAARALLDHGAKVNLRSGSGETALIHAVGTEQAPAIVAMLLAHGADVNARGRNGYTARDLAAIIGQTEIVTLLQKAGAKR